jgi:hypothetical protein
MFCTVQEYHVLSSSRVPCFVQCKSTVFSTVQEHRVLYSTRVPCFVQCKSTVFCTVQEHRVLYSTRAPCFVQYKRSVFFSSTAGVLCLFSSTSTIVVLFIVSEHRQKSLLELPQFVNMPKSTIRYQKNAAYEYQVENP